ncbi:hypothetical protein IKF43_01115 [Candidatus Saccharibacteria bacterium]|nr:hypothetical protein [Candidatus Saccharibacteria bacterium]
MKKTKKRVFGLVGLGLVAITTIFAASLPGPEAAAIESDQATDTIVVRVVGADPLIEITSSQDGKELVQQEQIFSFKYYNSEYIDSKILYTNDEDVKTEHILIEGEERYVKYHDGEYVTVPALDLLSDGYGYGEYVVESVATGYAGVTYPKTISFSFIPVKGEAAEDPNDGLIYLHLDYDTENENIDHIKINVYDESGNIVKVISPIVVVTPGMKVELPFSENDLPTGNYTIGITAYNAEDELLYGKPYYTSVYYEAIPVPDTGGMFTGMNISKTDYLVTGLIVFSLTAILGFVFVARGRNNESRLTIKKRRR